MENLKGLGIHLTKSLNDSLKLGPNAYYVDKINYDINNEKQNIFFKAAKEYLPFINEEDLSPDMVGIRPKLQKEGDSFRDFVISHEVNKGLRGLINLIGIESPGLTSALSIGKYVNELLEI